MPIIIWKEMSNIELLLFTMTRLGNKINIHNTE